MSAARARSQGLLRLWPLLPALLLLGIFMVYPVADLLSLSFTDQAGRISIQNLALFMQRPVYARVLQSSFLISAYTTVICLVLAYPVSYYLASSAERVRSNLLLVVVMPFWTGFLVRTCAWLILLAPSGPLTQVGVWLGFQNVKLAYNLTGVLIGMSQALLPLAVLNMLPVMLGIDRNLLPAAAIMGARPAEGFWRVYFPLSLPGVAASGLLVFISALGFFITPTILGGPQETMIAQLIIVQIQELLNWRFAGVLSLVLLISALVVYYAYDRILGMSTLVGERAQPGRSRLSRLFDSSLARLGAGALGLIGRAASGMGLVLARLTPAPLRRPGRALQTTLVALILAFLMLPTLFVIPVSFTQSTFLDFPPRGLTLRWYEEFIHSQAWMSATIRSLYVAAIVAVTSMLLGGATAFTLARESFYGKKLLLALVLSPLILPRMVIAVALFYLAARLHFAGTDLALVIGHTIIAFPFVVVTVMVGFQGYNRQYDRAAAILGAKPSRTLLHVTLPLMRSSLAAAAIFAFMTSFDDLNIALFLTGGEQNTLPKQMWSAIILQATPILGVASTVLLILISAFLLASEVVRRQGVIRRRRAGAAA
ncbi:MAG: ABC transporter permease subunit [Acidisphaera sp.]|nr:ABC transporter permease subunit [Acidisphaera sp.]